MRRCGLLGGWREFVAARPKDGALATAPALSPAVSMAPRPPGRCGPPRPRLKGQATGAGGESQNQSPAVATVKPQWECPRDATLRPDPVPSPWRFRPSRRAGGGERGAKKTAPRQAGSIDTPKGRSATRRAAPHVSGRPARGAPGPSGAPVGGSL
ncbi:MAG: hypothetical protein IPL99_29505 [Candidatus Competibacteraceae bacterium]|nr:hypothetical protein [Candidatus Competibacteraceae bacterium]